MNENIDRVNLLTFHTTKQYSQQHANRASAEILELHVNNETKI